MKLYTYWRSSASYRVRIVLNLKNIYFEPVFVNLKNDEHLNGPYADNLPSHCVPTLEHNNIILSQSTAIIEYLEEIKPTPQLLPKTPKERAIIRSFCQTIACDIHPLNNLKVLRFLDNQLQTTSQQKNHWYENWIHEGFAVLEKAIEQNNSVFCFGNTPTLADCYLIPQVYNALRFNVNMQTYTSLMKVYNHCIKLDSFITASPEKQQDCAL